MASLENRELRCKVLPQHDYLLQTSTSWHPRVFDFVQEGIFMYVQLWFAHPTLRLCV